MNESFFKVNDQKGRLSDPGNKAGGTELDYMILAEHAFDWETWEDDAGTIRYVSPSCGRISGYSADEFKYDPSLFDSIIVGGGQGGMGSSPRDDAHSSRPVHGPFPHKDA